MYFIAIAFQASQKALIRPAAPLRNKAAYCLLLLLLALGRPAQAQTYILNEDFSTATGTTPPSGWTNTAPGTSTDRWTFDNESFRSPSYPVSGKFALFDSERLSNNGLAENASLETKFFDASVGVNIILYFDHTFVSGSGAKGTLEAFNGLSWVNVRTYTASTANPASEFINLSTLLSGVTNAKLRFRWEGNGAGFWAVDNIRIFSPITLDAGLTGFTAPVMPISLGSKPVRVRLANFGASNLTSTQLSWTANGVPQTPISWTGNLAMGSSQEVTLGNYTFQDRISVVFKAWLSNPNGQTDANRKNDTIVSSPFVSYNSLCGTYTVGGASPDFEDLGDVAAVLNNAGISCPVVFKLRTGTNYAGVTLNGIAGSSATNTITFESELGDSATTIVSGYRDIITLDGTDNLIFRKLTFRNTNTGGHGILGINGNQNLKFNSNIFSINAVAIGISALVSDLEVRKCRFPTGAIYAFGSSETNLATGVRIEVDTLNNTSSSNDALSLRNVQSVAFENLRIGTSGGGIHVSNVNDLILRKNRITHKAGYDNYGIVGTANTYLTIEDNTIRFVFGTNGGRASGIWANIGDGYYAVVRRNYISGTATARGTTGISVAGSMRSNYTTKVDSNTIRFCNTGLALSCRNVLARGNAISYTSSVGLSIGDPVGTGNTPQAFVERNRIVAGIGGTCLSVTSTNARVQNNFFYIGGTTQTTGFGYNGKGCKLYFNTFQINSTNTGSVGFNLHGGNGLLAVNNIFANIGKGAAVKIATARPDTAAQLDYNDYFSADGQMGTVGTTTLANLLDLQAKTLGDRHSVAINPVFTPTGSMFVGNPGLGEAGIRIFDITEDLLLNPRPNPPTIGAWERSGCSPDAALMGFVDLPNRVPAGTQPIKVVLKNSSSDNVTLDSATVRWTVNNVVQTDLTYREPILAGGGQYTLTLGSVNFVPGSINYIKAWVIKANGQVDCNHYNDTIKIGPITTALCGTYTIGGTNPDFPNFTAAVNTLNLAGIACNVVFKVRNGIYSDIFRIDSIAGSSDTATVTFEAETGDSATVQLKLAASTTSTYMMQLNGASHVRFRKIGFPDNSYRNTLDFVKYPSDIVFHRCLIDNITSTGMGSRVSITHCHITGACSMKATAAKPAVDFVFENDTITNTSFTIDYFTNVSVRSNRIYGYVTIDHSNEVTVTDNRVRPGSSAFNMTGSSNVLVRDNLLMARNTFSGGIKVSGSSGLVRVQYNRFLIAQPSYYFGTAIWVSSNGQPTTMLVDSNYIARANSGILAYLDKDDSTRIMRNVILGVSTDGIEVDDNLTTATVVARRSALVYGNRITGMTGGTGITLYCNNVHVINNFIQGAKKTGKNNSSPNGIYYSASSTARPRNWRTKPTRIYFNTVNIQDSATRISRAFEYWAGSHVDVRNNVFANMGEGYGASLNQSIVDSGGTFDYNDYYSAGGKHGRYLTQDYSSLSAFRAAVGQNLNSKMVNPAFVAAGPDIGEATLGVAGIAVDTIRRDIDGQLRPNRPTIGARERGGCSLDAAPTAITGLQSPILPGPKPIRVTIQNLGEAPVDSLRLQWSYNNVVQPAIRWEGRINAGQSSSILLGSFTPQADSVYRLAAWILTVNGRLDCTPANDSTRTGKFYPGMCGIYTIGGTNPDFPTFEKAVEALNGGGITCPVTFRVRTAIYREAITINPILGASKAWPVVFESEAGDSIRCRIYTPTNMSSKPSITLNGTRHIHFRKIGIEQSNTVALRATGSVSDITFTNCYLEDVEIQDLDSNFSVTNSFIYGFIKATAVGDSAHNVLMHNDTLFVDSEIRLTNVIAPVVTRLRADYPAYWTGNGYASVSLTQCPNAVVENNRMAGGIQVVGNDAVIRFNKLYKSSSSQSGPGCGIRVTGARAIIHQNSIVNTGSSFSYQAGIYMSNSGNDGAGKILIDSNQTSRTGGVIVWPGPSDTTLIWGNTIAFPRSVGVHFKLPTGALTPAAMPHVVANNKITGISFENSNPAIGILIDHPGALVVNNFVHGSGTGISVNRTARVIYNSVHVKGSSPAMRVSGGASHTIKNNIFSNFDSFTWGSAISLYSQFGTLGDVDYNTYYSFGGRLGDIGGTLYNTLAQWRQATLRDPNSLDVDPQFLSETDLRPQQRLVNGGGTPVPNLILDIDAQLRNGSAPDPGADEFTVDFGITRLVNPTLNCNLGPNDSITVNVTQFGDVPLKDLKIAYQMNRGTIYVDTIKGSIYNDIQHTFRQRQNLATTGVYSFKVWLINTTDDNKNNDTLRVDRFKGPSPVVNYTFLTACANQPVRFQGTASVSPGSIARYEWLFGDGDSAGVQNPAHLYDTSGTYPVVMRAYSNQGCYSEVTKPVTLTPTPRAAFTPANGCVKTTILFLNTTEENGTSVTYLWKFGDGTTSTSKTPKSAYYAPGVYTVWLIARSANGCVDSVSHPITVYPNPVVTTTPSDTVGIAAGGSVNLQANEEFPSYRWTNGLSFREIVVTTPGRFSVMVADSNNCRDTSEAVVVIQRQAIRIDLGRDTSLCQGRSLTLGVPGTYERYLWSTGATTPTITVDTSGLYTLTVTGRYGMQATDNISVQFTAGLAVSMSGLAAEYCLNAPSVLLTGTPAGGVFSGPGITGGMFLPSAAGVGLHTIKYTYTNAAGCGGIATRTVWVRSTATPTVTATGPLVFCQGDSVILASSTVLGNQWSHGPTTQSIVVKQSGSYSVRTTQGNCTSGYSDTLAVLVKPRPVAPTVTADDTLTFCQGDSVTLTSSAGDSTRWSDGYRGSSVKIGVTATLTATVSAGGCSSPASAPVSVVVNPLPTPPVITVSGATRFCQGDSAKLVATGITGIIQWSQGDTTRSIIVRSSGLYHLAQYDRVTGCVRFALDAVPVTVDSIPNRPHVIQVAGANTVSASTPAAKYEWYFNGTRHADTTQSFQATQDGYYYVVAISAAGCRSPISDTLLFRYVSIQNSLKTLPLSLAPNPASREVRILGLQTPSALAQIFDAAGRQVWTQTLTGTSNTLPVRELPRGLYTVSIRTKEGVWTGKLMVAD